MGSKLNKNISRTFMFMFMCMYMFMLLKFKG